MSETFTLAELADALAPRLSRGTDVAWKPNVPVASASRELWLHARGNPDVGSIGVFSQRVVVWIGSELRSFAVPSLEALDEAEPAILEGAREQLARYRRHQATTERLSTLAEALTRELGARLRAKATLVPRRRASHGYPGAASIHVRGREAVRLDGDGDAVRVGAGAIGPEGWEGELVDVASALEPIVDALTRASRLLTLDRLVTGARYRVLESIQELRGGSVVRFLRFEDVDNHYGRYVFADEEGVELRVDGDFSVPSRSVLAETHRYLAALSE